MPITSTDLLFKYSCSGGPGNLNDQPDPNQSLGDFMSDTPWTPWFNGSGSLFYDQVSSSGGISGTIASGQVDYRCIFLHNNNPSLTLVRPVAWVTNVYNADIQIGADPTIPTPAGSATQQAISINVSGALYPPPGVTFIPASGSKQGLVLGNLPAGYCEAIWIQRTAASGLVSGNLSGNSIFTLRVMGDTMP